MMKFTGVSELAHGMEDVLDAARTGRITISREVADILFKGIDALSFMLDRIAAGEQPDPPPVLRDKLKQVAGASAADVQAPQTPLAPNASQPLNDEDRSTDTSKFGLDIPESAGKAAPLGDEPGTSLRGGGLGQSNYVRINATKLDDLIQIMGEVMSGHSLFKKNIQQLREFDRDIRRHLESVAELLARQGDDPLGRDHILMRGDSLLQTMHKISVAVSEGIMMQDYLISEFQDASLKLRMLPLSTAFEPLRRTARDLAREFGKDINFVIEGGETEIDRKIAERIGDSLMHMIRNALDHGIESAQERILANKPSKGTIALTAFYENGGVSVALRDDGRGLCTEKIRENALAKRLYDAETLGRMTRAEINNLIFIPGFSTSPIITDISGRGVGMDVVRKNIVDELKGAVIIETQEGIGTTFLLRLPINLAVFPLFFVVAGGTVWALPSTFVTEMVTVANDSIIEIVDKRALRLREQIIPVEDLAAILKIPNAKTPQSKEAVVVIVRDGESKLGLLVEEILAREETVVKPLPTHLQKQRIVIGGAIGDGGSIINVLHVPELLRMARDATYVLRKPSAEAKERGASILVVDDSMNTREIEKSILEAYGYVVDVAEDGQEALEKVSGELYDLVITDVEMPRLDGFSLAEALRADQRYRNVPIIIVTSREKEEDKRRGIQVGADAYIVKRGFDQSNLLDTVKSLIG